MGGSIMTQQLPQGFVLDASPDPKAQELPEGFVVNSPASDRDDLPEGSEDTQGVFESVSNWFSGNNRTTPTIERTPTIVDGGFLAGENIADVAQVASMTMLTNDPNEIANIFQKQIPGIRVIYNKDAQGEIYPVLVNSKNEVAMIDKPGMDLMNLGQFLGQASVFATGGVSGGIVKMAATEGAKEAALQAAQSGSGGRFDTGDVAATVALSGAMSGLSDVVGLSYRAMKGEQTPDVEGILATADAFNVPVMTSDIYKPENWFSRGTQFASESIPAIGTGGLRNAQQDARQAALEDFVSLHQGGSYEEIIRSIGSKSEADKKAAGAVYNKINPYLDQVSRESGLSMPNANQSLDELTDYLLTPGLRVDQSALDLADDMHDAFTAGDQTYQVLRDNISSWHEKLNSIDPAVRSQMPTKVKAKFEGVLNAARRDRDLFSKNNLTDQDYTSLKTADAKWGEISKGLKETKIKSLLDKGEMTPEIARTMLYSTKESEVKQLFDALTPQGRASARSAIIMDVVNDLKRRAGEGYNPNNFVSAMKRKDRAVDVFFDGRREELDGFIKMLDLTSRAQDVQKGAGSQTAERVVPFLATAGTVGGVVPVPALAAYGSVGAMARVFESPKVRNMLVRINSLDPNSTEAQRLAQSLSTYIFRPAVQADPSKGESQLSEEISREFGGNIQ
jgi:hypothetical protein